MQEFDLENEVVVDNITVRQIDNDAFEIALFKDNHYQVSVIMVR